jgi:hypothetical protein
MGVVKIDTLRAHAFVTVLAVGVLIGGGLRFIPASAAAPGSAGSTACAAPK